MMCEFFDSILGRSRHMQKEVVFDQGGHPVGELESVIVDEAMVYDLVSRDDRGGAILRDDVHVWEIHGLLGLAKGELEAVY